MIEYFIGKDGQWYFRLKGLNGETVVTSEGYTRKRDAKRGAQTLREMIKQMIKVEPPVVIKQPSNRARLPHYFDVGCA